jgi:hypothetical protein
VTAPTSGPDGDDLAVPDVLEAARPLKMWQPLNRNVRALDRWIREHYGSAGRPPRHICTDRYTDPDDCAACQHGLTDPAPPGPPCVWDHPGCDAHPAKDGK